jgi:DNA ligase 1
MAPVLLQEIVRTSAALVSTASRLSKVDRLAECLRLADPLEVPAVVAFLSGTLRQRHIGVGYASLQRIPMPTPAVSATLRVAEVDAAFATVGDTLGPGSTRAKHQQLVDLFARATAEEQPFLRALVLGEVRQGALEGVVTEALARAADVPGSEVRRALMLRGSLAEVATAALAGGVRALRGFALELGRPVLPMLAQAVPSVTEAMARISPAAVEWKLDGIRAQIHRHGREVSVFTRTLDDITDRVPEVVEMARALPGGGVLLDCELIALRPDGRPYPFQVTAGRVGSRNDVASRQASVPLTPFVFDVLHLDGTDLLERPYRERRAALSRVAPAESIVPGTVTDEAGRVEEYFRAAVQGGHEGLMVKDPDSPYAAGRRGAGWLKVKPRHTLDLVVLAAEWGSGRRRGWLSNLHLGARDDRDERGGFVMLGKTFKGMTDAMLTWQTERLLALTRAREGQLVRVRPELVVEVAFDGVQTSPRYPGGLALRFARVLRYRPDKQAAEADPFSAVQALAAPG